MQRPYCRIKNKKEFDIGSEHPMYCCEQWIDGWVNERAVPISYNPYGRFYYIICESKTWIQIIPRCVLCGHLFPGGLDGLVEEWIENLKKEYNIDFATARRNPEKVPEEFKTEEWWRKRGL